jgi:hypothetical protein
MIGCECLMLQNYKYLKTRQQYRINEHVYFLLHFQIFFETQSSVMLLAKIGDGVS